MTPPHATDAPLPDVPDTPPIEPTYQRTPMPWRLGLLALFAALTVGAYAAQGTLGPRGIAGIGAVAFFVLAAAFSRSLQRVNWRTIVLGVGLQLALAVLVIQVPAVQQTLGYVGTGVKKFIGFADEGAKFVFGNLYDPRPPIRDAEGRLTTQSGTWSRLFEYDAVQVDAEGKPVIGPDGKPVIVKNHFEFQFAFVALPPILFVSAFFTVLYHFGVLQWVVRLFAKVMVYLLGTSGAETLSVSANVFMGQTEAPLIVKPYIPRMTNSELFALMVSGFAHISGGMMAVYINYGADPVAVITTCIMACPCSLYLAKLIMPEVTTPETSGLTPHTDVKSPYVNAVDAAASGTTDGLRLALNVAAMLIVFIAFVAMFDGLLGTIKPALALLHLPNGWVPEGLSLRMIFGWLFSPAALLMGVDAADQQKVGSLLGAKLSINEHFAYLEMKKLLAHDAMQPRSFKLAAFALTGFANFSSVGIQLGGIGAMAPSRRHDLARLGGIALFAGFLATLLNASIAGILME